MKQDNHFKVKFGTGAQKPKVFKNEKVIAAVNNHVTFGKACRSGTPVKGIINGDYGVMAEK